MLSINRKMSSEATRFDHKRFLLLFILLPVLVSSCTTLRDGVSESGWAKRTLVIYDKHSKSVKKGLDSTVMAVGNFISEADEIWLQKILDSLGEHDKKTPAGPRPPPDGQYNWPVKHSGSIAVSSQYGIRHGRMHRGIDLAAPTGTPVYAVADGEIILADNSISGFGNLIILKHRDGRTSYYAHNSKLVKRRGDFVRQGTRIALVGSTGRSTGSHLHFEVREGRTAVNPCRYLVKHDVYRCKYRS